MTRPVIRVTETARLAVREAAGDGAANLRIDISDQFVYGLSLGEPTDADVVVPCEDVMVLLDPESASRADGLSVDYVAGEGFTISNPSAEPPRVRPLSVTALKAMLDRGDDFVLMDVRTSEERAIARIDGSRLLDREGHDYLMALDRATTIVFQCHHGIRSQAAAEYCLREGFRNLFNLTGGIDAWSIEVDPDVPRY